MDRREIERIKTVPTPVDLVEMTASVLIMAFGVIITVRSLQGVSPVSSLIYVMSEASGLTLGTMTFIVYLVFVLVQCAVYRDRGMTVRVFSQLPYTVLYSVCMDLFDYVLASLGAETLAGQGTGPGGMSAHQPRHSDGGGCQRIDAPRRRSDAGRSQGHGDPPGKEHHRRQCGLRYPGLRALSCPAPRPPRRGTRDGVHDGRAGIRREGANAGVQEDTAQRNLD